MQRGRDADVAAKLQQQYQKEVSDQQWHLSIIPESHSIKYASSFSVGGLLIVVVTEV
jgi:hypothetical protein